MIKKITSGQRKQYGKLLDDVLTSLNLTKEDAQASLADFPAGVRQLILKLTNKYFVLISDEDAVKWMVKFAQKSELEATLIVDAWRKKAHVAGIADHVMIHAVVQPGVTFKRDIPKFGPCYENFHYLQGWDFPDPPTVFALISWIPMPLYGTTSKNVDEQKMLLATFKAEAGLPESYEISFGSVGHVAGIALAHFGATGHDPFGGLYARTDTRDADGDRLSLYWCEGRLYCVYWVWDELRSSDLAVFAVGVTVALGR